MNNFYLDMEETVRPFVKELRDNGINTICSCEHEGFIQAVSADPTTEKDIIFTAMYEMGVKEWVASLLVTHLSNGGYWSFWEIKSPDFKNTLLAIKDEEVKEKKQ